MAHHNILKMDLDQLEATRQKMLSCIDRSENNLADLHRNIGELTSPEVWNASAAMVFNELFAEIRYKEGQAIEALRLLHKEIDREGYDWLQVSQTLMNYDFPITFG